MLKWMRERRWSAYMVMTVHSVPTQPDSLASRSCVTVTSVHTLYMYMWHVQRKISRRLHFYTTLSSASRMQALLSSMEQVVCQPGSVREGTGINYLRIF